MYYRVCVHREVYDRLYWISLCAIVTGQVYRETLLVLFTGLVYLLCFVLLFKQGLLIEFTNRVLQFKWFNQVYGSSLWVVIFAHILRREILF